MVSAIDITIVIVYLLIMLGVGYLSGKNNKTQDDYFLAGHSMPWIPVALSVAATMISANGFIGGPGWAYTSGMAPVMVNITVPLAVCFALSITTPVFYRMKVTSVYEYMGKRMGKYTRALTIYTDQLYDLYSGTHISENNRNIILCFSAICCNYGFIVHIDGGNQSSYLDRQYTDDSCYRFSYYDYVYGCQRLWIKLIGYAFCSKRIWKIKYIRFFDGYYQREYILGIVNWWKCNVDPILLL